MPCKILSTTRGMHTSRIVGNYDRSKSRETEAQGQRRLVICSKTKAKVANGVFGATE